MKWLFATDEGTLTDDVFLKKVIFSVAVILICITALCSATYALFSEDVSAGQNNIVSGNFSLDFTVENDETDVEVTKAQNGEHFCTLTTPGTYTVTLKMSEISTATKGYCAISVAGETYKTAPVYRDQNEQLTFTVTTQQSDVKVVFIPIWGIAAHENVQTGDTLVIEAQATD